MFDPLLSKRSRTFRLHSAVFPHQTSFSLEWDMLGDLFYTLLCLYCCCPCLRLDHICVPLFCLLGAVHGSDPHLRYLHMRIQLQLPEDSTPWEASVFRVIGSPLTDLMGLGFWNNWRKSALATLSIFVFLCCFTIRSKKENIPKKFLIKIRS